MGTINRRWQSSSSACVIAVIGWFLSGVVLSGVAGLAADESPGARGAIDEAAMDKLVVHDPRLQLELIAEDPQIVTPIGLAIDSADRLYVLESHTHQRPGDYQGPSSDRVKQLSDRDGDGRFEELRVFAEGIRTGMNLAFSPSGVLHVVCAKEVLALHDDDGDGVCDRQEKLIELKSKSSYGHSALLGITFDRAGNLYVSRGNLGGQHYRCEGTDGSFVEGYGDGGNIIRCLGDGTEVAEFATGFWNPFSIKFDSHGRLLCVDNDPDARGPNRLVHVVAGGDYGHKIMFGGGGNHPFQGWDGDLPGTLPYIGGTGEAPCDLLDCRLSNLPDDYAESLLVTVWNENTIERHPLRRVGDLLKSQRQTLVSGGDDFRPVALAADSRGNLYFTDWVLVAYPNHGRGRVWRLTNNEQAAALTPRGYFDPPLDDLAVGALSALLTLDVSADGPKLTAALSSHDPFLAQAATQSLARSASVEMLRTLRDDERATIRLGGMLASLKSPALTTAEKEVVVGERLRDPDAKIRQAALIAAGTGRMTGLRSQLDQAIDSPDVSTVLFQTYLAAVECLQPEFVDAYNERRYDSAKKIPRPLPDGLLAAIALDSTRPAGVRALAVSRLDGELPAPIRELLWQWVEGADGDLQVTAIRRLAQDAETQTSAQLLRLATDGQRSGLVRAEAILALSSRSDVDAAELVPLVRDAEAVVAIEAARALKHLATGQLPKLLQPLQAEGTSVESISVDSLPGPAAEALRLALGKETHRPQTLAQWIKRLQMAAGDPTAGRRVFYSPAATCSRCHTIGAAGGTLGPDLSNIAQSVDRGQIARSILDPSQQFAPQYQAWQVLTVDGQLHTGLQLDHQPGGAINMLSSDGQALRFAADDIAEYRASENSLMPSGLERALTVSELADLLAFLESLR